MDSKEEWRMIGEKIRLAREAKGLTQEQLLKRINNSDKVGRDEPKMSPSTLSLVENGKRKPRPATLQSITDALGIQFEDFFPELSDRKQFPMIARARIERSIVTYLNGDNTSARVVMDVLDLAAENSEKEANEE